jgi:hypothetical protein
MSLANLLKTGQLKEHSAEPAELERLITAAARGIADARAKNVSAETRYDAAYRAITQIGLAAMMAAGYRPNTNQPGHHATLIQTLPLTLGVEKPRVLVLDTLRRKRNLIDYTGEEVDEGSVKTCAAEAEKLLHDLRAQLAKRR